MRERLIERLAAGETIPGYRESGNSMTPIIEHRQPVDLRLAAEMADVASADTPRMGGRDMVMILTPKGRGEGGPGVREPRRPAPRPVRPEAVNIQG